MDTIINHSTKEIIVDACALLNWIHGEVTDPICSLPLHFYFIGNYVIDEIISESALIDQLVSHGKITRLDPSHISGRKFLSILELYQLGTGESECIAYALKLGLCIATDDRKARGVASDLLGNDRVTGTLGLIIQCIELGTISESDAATAYKKMKDKGAFLPAHDFLALKAGSPSRL